ncbi:MAG: dephospho-CoA kinase [Tepidanaerobacteraceae bacterium]|nr:dephospho-CoA kinase [Tepidanaerobacter sp.]HQA59494.1 dephospho-CoA kinase [Tepidanaerobacteraceae bacterium]HQE05641.1 dephospho-CoA kinase [Tepidanaerobacteraceae bacterium]
MFVVGLTGGIASGKSTVSLLLKDKGAVIIDADEIARQIMQPDKPAWFKVINHFGHEILNEEEYIDRKKLADIVFSDKRQLEFLNSFTHPEIINEIKSQLEYYKSLQKEVVIIDAALLLEVGLDAIVDEVWVVTVDEKVQLERLMNRDKNLNKEQAMSRIRSQMPQEEKIKYADRVIDNSGSIEDTKVQVDSIWREISRQCQKNL